MTELLGFSPLLRQCHARRPHFSPDDHFAIVHIHVIGQWSSKGSTAKNDEADVERVPAGDEAPGERSAWAAPEGFARGGGAWRRLPAAQARSEPARNNPPDAGVQMMTTDESMDPPKNEICDLLKHRDSLDVDLAQMFCEIRRAAKGTDQERNAALSEFAYQVGFQPAKSSKATYLANVVEHFERDIALAPAEMRRLGWSTLAMTYEARERLGPAAEKEVVALARKKKSRLNRVRAVRKWIEARGGKQKTEKKKFDVYLDPEQMEIVDLALDVAAATTGSNAKGYNLGLIASAYLASDRKILPAEILKEFKKVPGKRALVFLDEVVANFVLAHEDVIAARAHRDARARKARENRGRLER